MIDVAIPEVKRARTDHRVHDLIKRRWSPRAFADRPVESWKLQSILEAARWAPSSFNEQPWRFILATKEDPEAYEQLLGCLNENNQRWARLAPVLMLSVAKKTFTRNDRPNRHSWHDVGLAAGNLIIQATALGLYVHQMAGILPEKAREVYHIPADFEPVAGMAIGYLGDPDLLPDDKKASELKERTRRPLTETVFEGTWGRTASVLFGEKNGDGR